MLIGRKEEKELLNEAYHSAQSEFVAVYGRRRIGKTFLIRETFKDRFTFQYTGVFNVSSKVQLSMFYTALCDQGLPENGPRPQNWFEAFMLLKKLIESSSMKRKIIFLDELPWMDARNSQFVSALEHFWNAWASARNDILLIICGSATSWIINKIIKNKGGLYNRVTRRISLKQFTLAECEELVHHRGLPFNRNMILEGYMVLGGVPYYWTKLSPQKSIAQNINDLFFGSNSELHSEFEYIYASMFTHPDKYIKVVEALAGKKSGLTRDEIIKKTKLSSNGQLTKVLEELSECGFVRKYCHTDKKLKDAIYQLMDCYTLFYFQFLKNSPAAEDDFWLKSINTPTVNTWSGLAFEKVCLIHTRQIKEALGIGGIKAPVFSWHVPKNDEHPGVQIDLLIDRADNLMNVCEIKYAPAGYILSAEALANIMTKVSVLQRYMPSYKSVIPVLITSNGARPNKYSAAINMQLESSCLFRPRS